MGIINKLKRFVITRDLVQGVATQTQQTILYKQKAEELTRIALTSTTPGVTKEKYCDHDIIVSLTTYGKRLYDVYLPIESIMQGSIKPNRIILWLDEEVNPLPRTLQMQQKRGLEVRLYGKNIKSHKKLIPSLLAFPNDAIVTIDDDLIYSFDLLENLVVPYLKDPRYIYSHRCHTMCTNEDGSLKPYLEWGYESVDYTPTCWAFPTGVGGTLYPPHSLDEEVFNEDVFMSICPHADDVWFKAMGLKKGTLVCSVFSHNSHGDDFLVNEEVQDIGLIHTNVSGGGNDIQIKAVFDKYDLYKYLR